MEGMAHMGAVETLGASSTVEALLVNARDRAAYLDLARTISSGNPLAMVGAGLSARIGYPTWHALLDNMHTALHSTPGDVQGGRESLRTHKDALWRATEYRRLLGDTNYRNVLRDTFAAEQPSDPCIEDIVRLPFRHVFTTNYDEALERAHRAVYRERPRYVNWARERDVLELLFRFFEDDFGRRYISLHGRHDDPDTIVFTDEDYTVRYVRTDDTVQRLFALFALQRVVFFGFSLEDPDLMAILRQVNAAVGFEQPRHFALVGIDQEEDREIHRGRFLKKFGISAVFYDRKDKHAALASLCRGLVEYCSPERGGAMSLGDSAPPPFHDPEDPHKGKFGGQPQRDDRLLSATVDELRNDWFRVTLRVQSTEPTRPLRGRVKFHLHDSFVPSEVEVESQGGTAVLQRECYGAFTVGVTFSDESTKLELDLAALTGAPLKFRMS
jgi:hypothetical protein